MSRTALRIFDYAEKRFQASGCTTFPTVREVAAALHLSQKRIAEECEGNPQLMLTAFHTQKPEPLGDHFVETLT